MRNRTSASHNADSIAVKSGFILDQARDPILLQRQRPNQRDAFLRGHRGPSLLRGGRLGVGSKQPHRRPYRAGGRICGRAHASSLRGSAGRAERRKLAEGRRGGDATLPGGARVVRSLGTPASGVRGIGFSLCAAGFSPRAPRGTIHRTCDPSRARRRWRRHRPRTTASPPSGFGSPPRCFSAPAFAATAQRRPAPAGHTRRRHPARSPGRRARR